MQHGKLFFSWKIWKYALLFNLPLVPHYLSSVILNAADRIMIEKMVGAREAGIYMVAYSISLIMTLFNTSILQTMEPWLYKKIKSHDIDDVKKVVHPAFAIIASVNVALIACAPEIVAIFAPKSYHNAIWIIPPVAMSSYFTFAYMFFCIFELYYEKTSLISIATILGAVLKLVLNYFLIYKFGYYAAAYATLICFVVYAIAHYCFMKKICLDYMHNVELYSTKILLLITSFFITLSFVMLCTYKTLFLRYLIIAVLIIFVLIRRMYIASYLQKLINIK